MTRSLQEAKKENLATKTVASIDDVIKNMYANPGSGMDFPISNIVRKAEVGYGVLRNPVLNHGLSFSLEERKKLNIHGLLPPVVRSFQDEVKRIQAQLDRIQRPLDKYIFLMELQVTKSLSNTQSDLVMY